MVTAYDYTAARIADAAGIPIILVGDSLGMVVLGYDSTVPVTMDDMVRHGRMVSRGSSQAWWWSICRSCPTRSMPAKRCATPAG